jgi:hypothetical protein
VVVDAGDGGSGLGGGGHGNLFLLGMLKVLRVGGHVQIRSFVVRPPWL